MGERSRGMVRRLVANDLLDHRLPEGAGGDSDATGG